MTQQQRPHEIPTCPEWRGKVLLWQEQALFLGHAASTSLHRSPAIKICIALDGEFFLRVSESQPWRSFQSAIIAPGQVHAIDGKSKHLAMLLLAPEGEIAQPLAPIYSQQGVSVISRSVAEKLSPLFADFAEADPCSDEAKEAYRRAIEEIEADRYPRFRNSAATGIDPRVASSLEQLSAVDAAIPSVKAIASNVALSESRFSHLFSSQLRVPMRRYLLWLRLREALHLLASGTPLTATAHEAGFADSAHLTRTFRGMLGITPSSLIKRSSLLTARQ